MNQRVPRRGKRYRSAEWILLFVAVLSALAFAAALAYVGYLTLLSLAGVPLPYALLVAFPLAVSVAACLLLARLGQRRQLAS